MWQAAYNIIIDRIMSHGVIPSFAVRYRSQLSDGNAIQLTWDGSQYVGTATDTNGVLSQYYFQRRYQRCERQPTAKCADRDGHKGRSGEAERLYQQRLRLFTGCGGHRVRAAGTQQRQQLPGVCGADLAARPRVGVHSLQGQTFWKKKEASPSARWMRRAAPLAGAELLLETSADGKTWTEVGRVTTDNTGIAKWERPQNRCAIPYYRNQSSRGVHSVDRAAVHGNAGQQQPRCHHHRLQQRRLRPALHRRYGIYNLFPVCSTRSHGGCLFLQKI